MCSLHFRREVLRQVFQRENFRKRCCYSSKFAWSLALAIRLHLPKPKDREVVRGCFWSRGGLPCVQTLMGQHRLFQKYTHSKSSLRNSSEQTFALPFVTPKTNHMNPVLSLGRDLRKVKVVNLRSRWT